MNTDTATSATPEAVCSTAMLGPVRRALDGLAFAAQLGDSADVRDWIEYVMRGVAAEREAAVAAERERWRALLRTPHRMAGGCPDEVAGVDSRDLDCPACRLMLDLGA